MDRTAYKNRHIKEHYDRINLVIPKGEKNRIKKICTEIRASVNEYLYMLVCNDLADGVSHVTKYIISLFIHPLHFNNKYQK